MWTGSGGSTPYVMVSPVACMPHTCTLARAPHLLTWTEYRIYRGTGLSNVRSPALVVRLVKEPEVWCGGRYGPYPPKSACSLSLRLALPGCPSASIIRDPLGKLIFEPQSDPPIPCYCLGFYVHISKALRWLQSCCTKPILPTMDS